MKYIYLVVWYGPEGMDPYWATRSKSTAIHIARELKDFARKQEMMKEKIRTWEALNPLPKTDEEMDTWWKIRDEKQELLEKEMGIPNGVKSSDPDDVCIQMFNGRKFNCVCTSLGVKPSKTVLRI